MAAGAREVVVTEKREVIEVPEKMPESPWHNKLVRLLEDVLTDAVAQREGAAVFRDLYFEFAGQRRAPDLAVVLQNAPPIERLSAIYFVPEDGPAPDVIVEVAVSAKSLGEAVGEKADFYAALGVKELVIIDAPPTREIRLWKGKPAAGEPPVRVQEAVLETLGLVIKAEGQQVRVFDLSGNELLPPRVALEQERARRLELERKLAQLQTEQR